MPLSGMLTFTHEPVAKADVSVYFDRSSALADRLSEMLSEQTNTRAIFEEIKLIYLSG
jgi:hypothetical protein